MSKYDLSILENELKKSNIILSDIQINQFCDYYDLLVFWNEKINLTSITEINDVIIKHFIDSVSIINFIDFSNIKSIIDIGTGAGFPGIPLKILFPEIEFVLLDSLQKRVSFLDIVISELGLINIKAFHGRAEELGRDILYREKFDLCVSRAVANLSSLTELCIPFVNLEGSFISYKSSKADEEIVDCKNAFDLLNCYIKDVFKFSLYSLERSFVVIKKKDSLSEKYPRRSGIPVKKPLR